MRALFTAYLAIVGFILLTIVSVWIDGIRAAIHTGPKLWVAANLIPFIGFWHGIMHLAGAAS